MRKFLALLCLLPLAVYAEQKGFDAEFDGDKPWAELQALLPAYPKPENMLPFDAGPASRNLHYIDAPSLTVEDSVVRLYLGNKIAHRGNEHKLRGDALCDRERSQVINWRVAHYCDH